MSYGELSILNGAAALYHFNGDINDSSGNGYNGTATNAPLSHSSGKFNQGASFGGSATSFIQLPTNGTTRPTGDFTISAWVKSSTTGATSWIYAPYNSIDSTQAGLGFGITSGNVLYLICGENVDYSNTHYKIVNGLTNVVDGKWHFVATTRTGGTLKLYVDGKDDSGSTVGSGTGLAYNTNAIPYIGKRYSAAEYYTGFIDELAIWNKVLTLREIRNIYAVTRGFI